MARGPAYPYISLGDAVAYARKLYDFSKRTPANLNAVVRDKFGNSPTSSSAVKIVAALRYFGLADTIAAGTQPNMPEMIKITDRAYRILVDDERSPERAKALKEAFLSPKAYKLCWDTWGSDLPESVRSTLIFSHGFNESSVDDFLRNYRKSIQYVGFLNAKSEESDPPKDGIQGQQKGTPKVGDYVQWEHDGVLGLPKALRLVKLSDDGSFAWVEGHTTGLPVAELIAAEAPQLNAEKDSGSRVIHTPAGRVGVSGEAPRVSPPKGAGMRQETLALDEGDAMLQWPENIGQNSIEDVEQWVSFLLKRLRRRLALEQRAAQQEAQAPEDEDREP
jgi:hypothetical protein